MPAAQTQQNLTQVPPPPPGELETAPYSFANSAARNSQYYKQAQPLKLTSLPSIL